MSNHEKNNRLLLECSLLLTAEIWLQPLALWQVPFCRDLPLEQLTAMASSLELRELMVPGRHVTFNIKPNRFIHLFASVCVCVCVWVCVCVGQFNIIYR